MFKFLFQSTSVSAKKTTKTYTYKTDSSGNVSTEVHTHVDSSMDQVQQSTNKSLKSSKSRQIKLKTFYNLIKIKLK
jgi:hypothetical protein